MGLCTFTSAPRCQYHIEIDATPGIIKSVSSSLYGRSCAASGTYFACSAQRYGSGLVVIYKMDTVMQRVSLLQIISPILPYEFSDFGYSLDMDCDLLVVGAYNYRSSETDSSTFGKGLVWVMQRGASDQYQIRGTLTAPGVVASKPTEHRYACQSTLAML